MTKDITTPKNFLNKWAGALSDYAVRDYNHAAFIKSANLAFAENKILQEALKTEKGQISVAHALRFASTTGLSLNPQEGKAALVAFKSKKDNSIRVGYQIMKNGMVDIALESGQIEFLTAEYVRENDEFKPKKTVDGDNYEFIPALKDRGNILGFFAALKLKSGSTHVKWMTVEEITEHRELHSPYSEMPEIGYGLKTVMKALLRNINISGQINELLNSDNENIIDVEIDHAGVTSEEVAEKLEKKETKKEMAKDGGLL